VEAPLEVNVAVVPAPEHIVAGLETAVNVGVGFTVTETIALLVHVPFDPITV
jgi:hypothetical protein